MEYVKAMALWGITGVLCIVGLIVLFCWMSCDEAVLLPVDVLDVRKVEKWELDLVVEHDRWLEQRIDRLERRCIGKSEPTPAVDDEKSVLVEQ